MTTEAQINANRANAQKSTGPRTPEGKATVAQNALQHGFWSQEVVIKGEDAEEFVLFRAGLLEELAPAGLMELILAERIVSLSWRLGRAERLQITAFEKVDQKDEPQPVMSQEDAGWLLAKAVERGISFAKPNPEGPVFGRKAVKDFDQERVLDRLLMYERRIEHSLYRTMAELRKLRKEGRGEGVRGSGGSDLTAYTGLLTPATPDVAMNLPEAEGQIDETKPICPDENGEEVGRGRPTYEETPGGVATNVLETEGPARGTKPIFAGNSEERVPDAGTTEEVGRGRPTLDQVEGGRQEEPTRGTKPISEGAASEEGQGASSAASNSTPATANSASAEPRSGEMLETKPIPVRRIKDNEGYRPYYRRRR